MVVAIKSMLSSVYYYVYWVLRIYIVCVYTYIIIYVRV